MLSITFQDADKRFSLELPSGWEMGPLPGGASGASFKRQIDDQLGLAAVRVFNGIVISNPASFIRQLSSSVEQEAGFRLLEEGSTDLAGLPAARRRYVVLVDGQTDLFKIAEDRVALYADAAYVVHVEALKPAFATFESDFNQIFRGFILAGRNGDQANSGVLKAIVGRWLMRGPSDTVLDLRSDGTFDLAGTVGRYAAEGNTLTMWPDGGGGSEIFSFKLANKELILSGSNLDEPIYYKREPSSQRGSGGLALIGQWAQGKRRLSFNQNATVVLDSQSGTYQIDGSRVILKFGDQKSVVRFKLKDNQLILTGGVFGKGTKFKRL